MNEFVPTAGQAEALKIIKEMPEKHPNGGGVAVISGYAGTGKTVVNATSQGMTGQAALDIRLDKLAKSALAADIIYAPLETPFLAGARKRGNKTVNGLGMLLHQGRPAWKAWFGIDTKVTPELRRLLERSLRQQKRLR